MLYVHISASRGIILVAILACLASPASARQSAVGGMVTSNSDPTAMQQHARHLLWRGKKQPSAVDVQEAQARAQAQAQAQAAADGVIAYPVDVKALMDASHLPPEAYVWTPTQIHEHVAANNAHLCASEYKHCAQRKIVKCKCAVALHEATIETAVQKMLISQLSLTREALAGAFEFMF